MEGTNTPYQNYISVKTLLACPEKDENGKDGYRCLANNGVEWWQDKESFEESNRPSNALTFGIAIEAMKKGRKVQRAGWNGKGMWLKLIHPYSNDEFVVHEKESMTGTLMPYIAMKTVDNQIVPWLASQTDMLAEDWTIVE